MSKKNIFAKFQDYVKKPKRNVFDLSFGNNLTTKFGQLTPVFCKECIPGDSFKIHSRFALQFMPMKFPVQTPMRAYLHFFYVRNRTLWKDWMDFIGKTKDNLTLPYVTPTDKKKFFRVGGLADYLGVPNVVYGEYGVNSEETYEPIDLTTGDATVDWSVPSWSSDTDGNAKLGKWGIFNFDYPFVPKGYDIINPLIAPLKNAAPGTNDFWTPSSIVENSNGVANITLSASDYLNLVQPSGSNVKALPLNVMADFTARFDNTSMKVVIEHTYVNQSLTGFATRGVNWATQNIPLYLIVQYNGVLSCRTLEVTKTSLPHDDDGNLVLKFEANIPNDALTNYGADTRYIIAMPAHMCYYFVNATSNPQEVYLRDMVVSNKVSIQRTEVSSGGHVIYDDEIVDSPYDSDIHLNALPFRAYEAIYNSYYRNAQNNPFVLDNVPEYNKYITTNEGGQDVTQYDLYQRNWEYDFLTSAVQTPQQGDIAPLVGISVTGEATFQDENGNTYYASAQYDSDGNITGWTSHSPDMPQGSLRLLMDMAGTGISINDLRNVNAFQKFLENNIRHGLKYRDQIKSHFGVDVRYDELDMPEFIGGCSTDVNINKLSQTSESGDTPLGSFVGQASAYGESKHDITHYCDEHGFIIGILSVVPVPVYSQLLPKYFVKNEQLDYYFPEFGHLGYQPILQKEVSPLQTFYAGDNLNAVFGYNRAWYDYLDSTDEVHAQFRTTMRDFIMNRTFDSAPELGEDFLLVDPDQLNDVFLAGTDDDNIYAPESDKIIGSMYFNVSKKSPIPLFGIPKLD